MPVAESNRVVPKSALRHRPAFPETETPSIPAWETTTPRASRPVQPKRKMRPVKCRKPFAWKKWRKSIRPGHQRIHWFVPVGLVTGVVLTILAQFAWSGMVSISDTMHYGMPRTMQLDAVVGHDDSPVHPTHLIGENLRGRVVIIEFPGGDAAHVRILVGPQIAGPNADEVPVLLTLVDRHGNHQPDLQVQFGSLEVWYTNQNGTFVGPS